MSTRVFESMAITRVDPTRHISSVARGARAVAVCRHCQRAVFSAYLFWWISTSRFCIARYTRGEFCLQILKIKMYLFGIYFFVDLCSVSLIIIVTSLNMAQMQIVYRYNDTKQQ